MKHDKKIISLLVLLFLAHQLFGIYVVSRISSKDLATTYSNSEISPQVIYLPIVLILASVFFIVLINYKKLLKYWHISALFLCGFVTLSALMSTIEAFILSALIIIIKKSTDDNYFGNISELIIYPSIAIMLLPFLNVFSAILLLLVISFYDVFAVYYSKHMITMAKTQMETNIFSGIRIVSKKESAIVGGGDIAFIMLLVCAVFRDYGLISSVFSATFSAIGLLLLLVLADKKKFYPAMPFLSISSVIGFFFSVLLTNLL